MSYRGVCGSTGFGDGSGWRADGVPGGARVLGAQQEAHMSTSPVPRTPELLVGVGTRLSTHAAALSPPADASTTGEAVRQPMIAISLELFHPDAEN